MNRREALTSVVAGTCGFSGCFSLGASRNPSEDEGPVANCRGVSRHFAVKDTAAVEKVPLSITADVERREISVDAPPRVRVTVRNESGPCTVDVREDTRCHLYDRNGQSDPAGLWLYHPQDTPAERVETCWTRDAPPDEPVEYAMYGCATTELGRNESITTTYEVWDDYTASGYARPGTYRFSTAVRVEPDDGETEATDSRQSSGAVIRWWMDLSVTEPDG